MPKKKVVNTIKKEKEQPVQHYLPSIEPVKQSEPPKKKDSKPVIASNQETPQQTVPWTIRLLAWFSSFVFHLTGIAHTTAAIYFNYHKHPNVEYLARFLTIWANALMVAYFSLALLCDIIPRCLMLPFLRRGGCLHEAFLRMVTSVNVLVLLMFWVLFFVNTNSVIPSGSDYPLPLNIAQHLICPLLLLLEIMLLPHKYPSDSVLGFFFDMLFLLTVEGVYCGFIAYMHTERGYSYPYPILHGLRPMEASGAFAVGLSLGAFVGICLRLLPRLNPIEAEKLKKE